MPPSLTTVGSVLRGIVSGKSVQTLERPAQDNELGILKVSAVTWGSFRPSENKALPPSYDPKDCPRPMSGDILISRANTRELVGAPVMVHGDYPHLLLSDKLLKLIPDETAVDARYLVRALRSPSASAHFFQCAGGSSGSMTNITQSDIRSAPIYLPPLEEQRRIAAILDQAETLRTQRRTALALLDSLTQSLFLDMFGDLATNPKSFQTKSLCEVATFYGGNSLPSGLEFTNQVGGYFLMKVSDMNLPGNEREILQCQSWSDVAGSKASTCPVGSIVVPKRGGAIGTNKKRITTRPTVLDPNLMAICPNPDQLNQEFLFQWFLGFDLASIASGSSVPQLNKQDLAPLTMLVPPLPLQQTFATRIASIEALKATHRRALAALAALDASLQQRAFAGAL